MRKLVRSVSIFGCVLVGFFLLVSASKGAGQTFSDLIGAKPALEDVLNLPTVPCDVLTPQEMEAANIYVIRQEDGGIRVVHSTDPLPSKFLVALMAQNRKVITPLPAAH